MFKVIPTCTAQRATKHYLRKFISSQSETYLNGVINVKFVHQNKEISGDFLLHGKKYDYSTTLNDRVESYVVDFVKRHGFTDKKDIKRVSGSSYYSLTSCPNLTVEQYVISANAAAVHLLVDEVFDNDLLDKKHIDIVERMCILICKYFRCDALPIDEKILNSIPKFENICRMYLDLGTSLVATGKDLTWIYQGFDSFINGYITQVTLPRPKSPEEYLERKTRNFGMPFYFELMCTLAEESLSPGIRNSAWFRQFRHATATMPPLFTDSASFGFDISHKKDSDNYTVILMRQGFSLKDAFHKTKERYNQLFVETLMLIAQLNKSYISDSDRKYLRLYLCGIRGAVDWATNFQQYNQQSIVKYCELQDEKRAARCVAEVFRSVPII